MDFHKRRTEILHKKFFFMHQFISCVANMFICYTEVNDK